MTRIFTRLIFEWGPVTIHIIYVHTLKLFRTRQLYCVHATMPVLFQTRSVYCVYANTLTLFQTYPLYYVYANNLPFFRLWHFTISMLISWYCPTSICLC